MSTPLRPNVKTSSEPSDPSPATWELLLIALLRTRFGRRPTPGQNKRLEADGSSCQLFVQTKVVFARQAVRRSARTGAARQHPAPCPHLPHSRTLISSAT